MQTDLFDRQLTPAIVLDALGDREGADNGITARDLVQLICGCSTAAGERRLRHVIEALRGQGHRIGAHPSTGYFLARTDAELDATCEFLYSRAMTSLRQIAVMKRVALPDLRGQLRLPLVAQAEETTT
jgi:hypothetical protein